MQSHGAKLPAWRDADQRGPTCAGCCSRGASPGAGVAVASPAGPCALTDVQDDMPPQLAIGASTYRNALMLVCWEGLLAEPFAELADTGVYGSASASTPALIPGSLI